MVALAGIVLTLVTVARVAPDASDSRAGVRWAALGAFLVAVAQIPMGGITIALDLHPLAVMTHFLLGLAAFGLASSWRSRRGACATASLLPRARAGSACS